MATSVVRPRRARATAGAMAPPSDVVQPTPPTAFLQATEEAVLRWIFKYAVVRRHFRALEGLDSDESIVSVHRLVLKPLQELITAGGRGVRRLRQLAELNLGQVLEVANKAGLAVLSSRLVAVLLRSRMTLILDLLCLNPGDDDVYSEFMRYFCSQAMEDLSAKAEVVEQELAADAGLFRDELWVALAMDTEGQAGLVASGRMTRDAESHRKKLLLDVQAVIDCFVQEGEGDVIEKILNGGLSITSGFSASEPALRLVHHCHRLRRLHSHPSAEALRGTSGCDGATAAVQLPCAAIIELVALARAGEFRQQRRQQEADDELKLLPHTSNKRRSSPQPLNEPPPAASASRRVCFTLADGGTPSAKRICRVSDNVESDLPRFSYAPAAAATDAATATRSTLTQHVGAQLTQNESTQTSTAERQSCRSMPSRGAGAIRRQQPTAGGTDRHFEGTASVCSLSSHGLLFAMLRERPRNIRHLLAMLQRHRVSIDPAALARIIRRLSLHGPSSDGGGCGTGSTKPAISISIAARVLLSVLGTAVPLKLSGRPASRPSAPGSQAAASRQPVVVTPASGSVSSSSMAVPVSAVHVKPAVRQEQQPTCSSAAADGASPVSASAALARLEARVGRQDVAAIATSTFETARGTASTAALQYFPRVSAEIAATPVATLSADAAGATTTASIVAATFAAPATARSAIGSRDAAAGATTRASTTAQSAAAAAVPASAAPAPTGDSHTAGRFGSACVTQWHYYNRTVASCGSSAADPPLSSADVRRGAAAPVATAGSSAAGTASSNGHGRSVAAAVCTVPATSAAAPSSIAAGSRSATDVNHCDWRVPAAPLSTRNTRPMRTDASAGTLAASLFLPGADAVVHTAALPSRQLAASRTETSRDGSSSIGGTLQAASAASTVRGGKPMAGGVQVRQGDKAAAASPLERTRVVTAFGRIATALACKGQAVPGTARWVAVAAAGTSCSVSDLKRCQVVGESASVAAAAYNVDCCESLPNVVVDEEMNRQRQADMLLVQEKDRRLLADEAVLRIVCGTLAAVDRQQLAAAAEPQPPASRRQPEASAAAGRPDFLPPAVAAAVQQIAEMPAEDRPATNDLTNQTSRCNDAERERTAVALDGRTFPLTSSSLPSAVATKDQPVQLQPSVTATVHVATTALPVGQHAMTGTEIIVDSGSDEEVDSLQHDRRPAPQAERRSVRRPPLPPIERHLRSSRAAAASEKTLSTGGR